MDELISNTLLNVDMEEKVYTSVINWVKHEPSERKKFVARVSKPYFLGQVQSSQGTWAPLLDLDFRSVTVNKLNHYFQVF